MGGGGATSPGLVFLGPGPQTWSDEGWFHTTSPAVATGTRPGGSPAPPASTPPPVTATSTTSGVQAMCFSPREFQGTHHIPLNCCTARTIQARMEPACDAPRRGPRTATAPSDQGATDGEQAPEDTRMARRAGESPRSSAIPMRVASARATRSWPRMKSSPGRSRRPRPCCIQVPAPGAGGSPVHGLPAHLLAAEEVEEEVHTRRRSPVRN